RLPYELLSDAQPWMSRVAEMADQVRKDRKPAASDNPFMVLQEKVSDQIVAALDAWQHANEAMAERTFLAVYGTPSLQAAAVGDPEYTQPLRKALKNRLHK